MTAAGSPQHDPRRNGSPEDERSDELIGLDHDDPEVRAFAEHLERVRRAPPGYTVEGSLSGVSDFADSANRLGGHRRLMAGIVALLIVLGVAVSAWEAIVFLFTTLFS